MRFEYDENKSQSNKLKLGVDFIEIQELWDDPYAFEIKSSKKYEEDRFLVLGRVYNKNYTVIITYRDTRIRIISARRSRKKEIALYDSIRTR